jgi:hypothetical protein
LASPPSSARPHSRPSAPQPRRSRSPTAPERARRARHPACMPVHPRRRARHRRPARATPRHCKYTSVQVPTRVPQTHHAHEARLAGLSYVRRRYARYVYITQLLPRETSTPAFANACVAHARQERPSPAPCSLARVHQRSSSSSARLCSGCGGSACE